MSTYLTNNTGELGASMFFEEQFLCSSCGEQYLHLFEIEPTFGGNDSRFGAFLRFYCEMCPNITTLEVLNWKGNTRMERSHEPAPTYGPDINEIGGFGPEPRIRLGHVVLPIERQRY